MAEEKQEEVESELVVVRLGNEEEEDEEKTKTTMTPWEQHSAVISIPRFNYNAPSSLIEHSHSGFLITCPIKREKSATKEAISILSKYLGSLDTHSSENYDALDENVDLKRRKICTEEIGQECVNGAENKEANDCGETSNKIISPSAKVEVNVEKGILSLVKLTKSGLLLLTFPRNDFSDTTNIVSNIFQCLDSGNLKRPNWCHRIFPIQATCRLNEEDLRVVVSKLVQGFVDSRQDKLHKPVKFAVAYNRRGMDETEVKVRKSNLKDSNLLALLDRNKCFAVVASVIKGILADSVVDLKSPEFAVLIELLPLSGIPNGSVVVAVSVLPHSLINTKPRLSIKALVSDAKK
ncbi:hypothetical protein FRX31_002169 [Thalictrum thalictroides]|uniref:THUMP domain-containing protein n=1 Tax=Thalictrum thalictroides TaxID=46969 RepID=A0A7J6XGE5_THATH|nr:hypothetical protein FRX31_002169 [Thalictrum thalictroides]